MKNWPFILGGLLVLLMAGGIFFIFLGKNPSQKSRIQPSEEKQVHPPQIEVRPFFSFQPRGDGKAIQISISGISKDAKIDYEITYNTALGLEQGIGGPVAQELGQSFYTREHIFGTCSKNVCTYDKGVENGKWKATITQGLETYELAGSWRLQKGGGQAEKLGFDDQFELAADVGTFPKSFFVITAQNSSLPKNLPKDTKLVAGPFTISPSEAVSLKKPARVSFSGENLPPNSQILQIGPTPAWNTLETKFDKTAKIASAQTSTFGTFVLVEKI